MPNSPDARAFRSFADLARAQVRGRDYEISIRRRAASRVAVIAPHGGEIENGTSEIAAAIAADKHNLYLFDGIRASRNYFSLHLTSHLFDEPECLGLIAACTTVIAIHGCGGAEPRVLLGGRDTALRDSLANALAAVRIRAETIGHRFPATQSSNICNRGASGQGVQIELTDPLRRFPAATAVVEATRAVLSLAESATPTVAV